MWCGELHTTADHELDCSNSWYRPDTDVSARMSCVPSLNHRFATMGLVGGWLFSLMRLPIVSRRPQQVMNLIAATVGIAKIQK
jgi:hypothetical protein